jgi:Domain of unknown function (DUF5655)
VAWTCPRCGRSFGRREQPHSCAPAADLDAWLAARPPLVSAIVAAVRATVADLGSDVILEATRAAVMVKRARTFAEVKPRRDSVELSFVVSRRIDDPRIARTLDLTSTRVVHRLDLTDAAQLDDVVRGWLVEAYELSPHSAG